jgi:UDP-N-acetylglucosamine acyltransferase
VTVLGHTTLGKQNVVHPGAVLGAPPQDLKHGDAVTRLVIGDRNQVREHVTFHPGTVKGGGITRIGSDGLFMVGSHVAHDGRVGDFVILANHVLLAGHVTVGDRAIMNGAAACHHFTTIGRLAYVGGLTRITRDIPPFAIAEGHPVRIRGANVVGMRRAGIDAAEVALMKDAIHAIFVSDREPARVALERLEREHPQSGALRELAAAIRASEAGRQGRAQERRAGSSPPPPAAAPPVPSPSAVAGPAGPAWAGAGGRGRSASRSSASAGSAATTRGSTASCRKARRPRCRSWASSTSTARAPRSTRKSGACPSRRGSRTCRSRRKP